MCNATGSGLIYPWLERTFSTIQPLDSPLPSLFLRDWPDISQPSSARGSPASALALVPFEGLFRRGRKLMRR